jgi:antitoxin ParD1/3/4
MPASYALGKQFERFIDDLVREGRYNSKSEVLREGLRLLQDREQERTVKIEELRRAFREGLDSGPGIPAAKAFSGLKAKYKALSR